ncbi:MAG: hypothetical protein ABSA83_20900 [Verrucomicrobiota bacterium]
MNTLIWVNLADGTNIITTPTALLKYPAIVRKCTAKAFSSRNRQKG